MPRIFGLRSCLLEVQESLSQGEALTQLKPSLNNLIQSETEHRHDNLDEDLEELERLAPVLTIPTLDDQEDHFELQGKNVHTF